MFPDTTDLFHVMRQSCVSELLTVNRGLCLFLHLFEVFAKFTGYAVQGDFPGLQCLLFLESTFFSSWLYAF